MYIGKTKSIPYLSFISEEFYKKWLCGRDENYMEEITPRKKMTSTMHLSRRSSKMSTRNISTIKNMKTSRDSSTLSQSDQLGPVPRLSSPPDQASLQVEESDAGTRIVRRKLLDLKSELKQSIFGFHQKVRFILPYINLCLFISR